jgi:hypothetical protein
MASKKIDGTNTLVREVTRTLSDAGYTVTSDSRNLDGDFCVSVADPKGPSGARCLVVFWPSTRAWPLAVYKGDQLYTMCDSAHELLLPVKHCLANCI